MGQIKYLDKSRFLEKAKDLGGRHWEERLLEKRWHYHSQTVEILKSLDISDAKKVLEMGTMGITCVEGSQTIDYEGNWGYKDKRPDYEHDARNCPWPFEEKQFEVFVALRVFQHLTPKQEDAFLESFRIARKVILVVPRDYNNKDYPDSKGLGYSDYATLLSGIHPNIYLPTDYGDLYYWDSDNPNRLNLSQVMNAHNAYVFENGKQTVDLIIRIKRKIQKLF